MKADLQDLCANIHLPDAALKQHIAFLAKTGAGKTYAAKGIVEKLLAQGRRVCIIDPTGAWWGLRSSSDGEKAGFEVVILGGTHGDAPLPALSGTFRNILSELRSAGLIDYPGTEAVYLTPDGSSLADGSEAPASLADLHGRIRHKLNGPQAKLFDYVIARKGGHETGRTELADHTGYTESSGTFRNLLSEMKGLGLFRYPTKRTVAATDILFPEGLR